MALYHPQIFDVADAAAARAIILTDEGQGATTDRRWAEETPYVLQLITGVLPLGPGHMVLDYGCGIGRIAKALIEQTGCSVVGVDISRSMRALAVDYVGSSQFVAVSPEEYDTLVRAGLRASAAVSVWVLQHCLAPADDVARMHRGLAPGGGVFVLNMPKRAVPAVLDGKDGTAGQFTWVADGTDVAALLRASFDLVAEGVPDLAAIPHVADAGAFWMALQRRAG